MDTKGNEVTFEYESLPMIRSEGQISGRLCFRDVTWWTQHSAFNDAYFSGPINPGLTATTGLQYRIYRNMPNITLEKSILKRINYSNSKLEFNLDNRLDIPYDKYIDGMQLFENNQVIESIDFTYSYFNNNHIDDEQKRLRLDNVDVNGKTYSFDYEGDFMPDKNSLSFDYWGMYNGMTNQSLANNVFRLFEDVNHVPSWVKPLVSSIDGMVNRSAHPSYCKVGMLNKITYPTGGSTEFVYELNTFDNIYFPNYDNKLGFNGSTFNTDYNQVHSQGCGLRIKETIDYTKVNEIALKKRYTYTGGKHIAPYNYGNQDPYGEYYFNHGLQGGSPFSTRYEARASLQLTSYYNNQYQTSLLGNGEGVGYDTVTVEIIDSNGANNGKTVLYYSNVPDKSAKDMFGQGGTVPQEYYDKFAYSIRTTNVDNGNLIKKVIFNSQNDTVQKTEYTYQSIVPFSSNRNGTSEITYNVKNLFLGSWAKVDQPCDSNSSTIYCNYYHHMFYYYPIKKTKTLLLTEKVTNYFDSNSIETLRTYTYNTYNLPTGQNLKDASGNTLKEQIKTLTTYSTPNIYTYVKTNIEKENGLKVNEYVNTYNTGNDYELTRVDHYPRGNGNPDYTDKLYYDIYDDKGNLNQFHSQNGIYTSIIWGYSKRYPIAKIENATFAQVTAALGGLDPSYDTLLELQNLSNSDDDRCLDSVTVTCNEKNLRTALTALRTSLPGAMVSTYTYDPLIGVTSMTDPKGYTVYYEYDGFNRLKQAIDADGHILSENEYNYKQ